MGEVPSAFPPSAGPGKGLFCNLIFFSKINYEGPK